MNKIRGKLALYLLFLLLFFYPFVATLSLLFNLNNQSISLFARGILTIVSVFIIFIAILSNTKIRINKLGFILIVFFTLYTGRVLYDIFLKGIIFGDNLFYTLSFIIGACFLPFLAIILSARHIDIKNMWEIFYLFSFLSNLCLLIIVFFLSQKDLGSLLLGRFNEIEIINPVSISLYGEILFVFSFFNLNYNTSVLKRVLYFLGLLLGLFFLLLGASRGPLISAVAIIFLFIINYHYRKKKAGIFILKFVFFLSAISFLIYFISMNFEIAIFERFSIFSDSLEDIQYDERVILWNGALRQFVKNPILGDSYLEASTNFFPHNIFVEVLMSTGIFGGFVFASALIFTLQIRMKSFSNDNDRNPQLFLKSLFYIYFISSFFSGGLFLSFELWITWALLSNCYKSIRFR